MCCEATGKVNKMATKAPLFYSLRRKHNGTFEVVAVTTLKPKRYHGSVMPYHETTHGIISDLLGKFGTEADAREVVTAVKRAYDEFKERIEAAEKEARGVRQLQNAAMQDVLNKAGAGRVFG
jgi:hypothetical protein